MFAIIHETPPLGWTVDYVAETEFEARGALSELEDQDAGEDNDMDIEIAHEGGWRREPIDYRLMREV